MMCLFIEIELFQSELLDEPRASITNFFFYLVVFIKIWNMTDTVYTALSAQGLH